MTGGRLADRTASEPGTTRPEWVRDYLVGFVLGVVAGVVYPLVRDVPDLSLSRRVLVVLGIGLFSGLAFTIRRGVVRSARRQAEQRRVEQGLPPAEEKSFRQELREHPVRTPVLLVLGVAGLGFAVWLKSK